MTGKLVRGFESLFLRHPAAFLRAGRDLGARIRALCASDKSRMQAAPIFRDRFDAGRQLADAIARTVQPLPSLVLALPRGGMPVGFEVAGRTGAELDVFLVRKLGFPDQEELAIGAIASGGVRVLNRSLMRELRVSDELIDQISAREEQELQRREQLYREGRPAREIRDRIVILVDDGLATGATMKAAVRAVRLRNPKRILIGVPVAAQETCEDLGADVHQIICVHTPAPFTAVGFWYDDFSQTTDEEVRSLLKLAEHEVASD